MTQFLSAIKPEVNGP